MRKPGVTMRTKDVVWLVLLILAVSLTICLKYFPYLPGDVSITTTDTVRAARIQALGSGPIVNSQNAVDLRAGRLHVRAFLGDCRMACRFVGCRQFHRSVVAGKMAWSSHCPATTFSRTGSGGRSNSRFRIPVHLCF